MHEQLLPLEPGISTYKLDQSNIIINSEAVFADSLILARSTDYDLDYRNGTITFANLPPLPFLKVSFLVLPQSLVKERFLYEPRAISDSLFKTIKPRKSLWGEQTGDLSVSGSKSFAVTFSDDEAFDLKQSLFVNLNGELGMNVNITAQLSDSQSKLTPEGDSKELSSLDQVFIKVYGKHYEIAMGDLELKYSGTRYMNYFSKFEGINASLGKDNRVQVAWSAGGGKRADMDISIIDGKQGPYYLNPLTYQTVVMIIAGSENIYRDGILLERGTDYFIDYTEGSVMFRTLVTASQQIHAYFQYSDEYYSQSTLFNSSALGSIPGFNITHQIIHQVDAKDNPLLFDLSPADKDSLEAAGDATAWGEGATQVEPGSGTYLRVTSPTGQVYYQYADNDSLADYSVFFSYVGAGNGDYEQYSSGKYRYLGPHLGDWMPIKRLVAPTAATNAGMRAVYSKGPWQIGIEGVYGVQDRNTLSSRGDQDNSGGIVSAFGSYAARENALQPKLELFWENRWAGTYLFSTYSDPATDADLAALPVADSLARTQADISASLQLGKAWTPKLALRYQRVPDQYVQRALRFGSSSRQIGLLPELILQNTIALQDPEDSTSTRSILQYHNLRTVWNYAGIKTGTSFNYRALEYPELTGQAPGFRSINVNPFIGFTVLKGNNTSFSAAFESTDIQDNGWAPATSSQTYNMKHITSSTNHNISIDATHRELETTSSDGSRAYDLINIRTNNAFLGRAFVLNGNYQLNQTEFFPKIRELQYIGDGLGLYDSTGVFIAGGDWDYVYITSGTGSLSTEINGQLNVYLKPGNLIKGNLARRINSDILISAGEQTAQTNAWRTYIFWPGYVFDEESSIYARQTFLQNIWLDLISNKAIARFQFEIDRSLDNRYQERGRGYKSLLMAELQLQQVRGYNVTLTLQDRHETESRYDSDVNNSSFNLAIQRPVGASGTLRMDAGTANEEGSSQISDQNYSLASYYFKPLWRSTWGRKGRLTAGITLQYNDRDGDDLLSFLPEKRAGFIAGWSLSMIYRLNNLSSLSLDYSGNSYPQDSAKHQLKLEFKAEL